MLWPNTQMHSHIVLHHPKSFRFASHSVAENSSVWFGHGFMLALLDIYASIRDAQVPLSAIPRIARVE